MNEDPNPLASVKPSSARGDTDSVTASNKISEADGTQVDSTELENTGLQLPIDDSNDGSPEGVGDDTGDLGNHNPGNRSSDGAPDQGDRSDDGVAVGGLGSLPGLSRIPRSGAAGFFTAFACSVFVFLLLNWPQPDGLSSLFKPLLFLDTTPSGGDMGAHVWGPAYLRDHLLTEARLSGWTPDWYAGFPAYHFYMVVPSLAIVALNLGLPYQIGIPLAAVVLFGGFYGTANLEKYKNAARVAAVVLSVFIVGLPYGVSFKLVSVVGLILFPLSAWAMGRLARCAEPIPGFLGLAAFIFLFDTNFSIYGGNIASTLAGEFAFSISLCIALVTIGLVIRALDDRIWRTRAAAAIALVPLCHLLPTFFVIPAILLALLLHESISRKWYLAVLASIALPFALFGPIGQASSWFLGKPVELVGVNTIVTVLAGASAVITALVAYAADKAVQRRANWLLTFGPIAVLLSAFWLLPFFLQRPYFNDMGWERLEEVGPPLLTVPIKIALPVAAIGLLLAYSMRDRIGLMFAGTGLIFFLCVVFLPEGKLWNARLLPFYYLSTYMVAAVGLGWIVRLLASAQARDFKRPKVLTMNVATACAFVAVLFAVSMPLRIVPFGNLADDGTYNVLFFKNTARSFIPSWVNWNYSGYEEKPSYGEYSSVVRSMEEVGETQGCGRAMWEYEKGLERYGTPMALMLLPFWTDGCIGSMEGLYFESSATTPFHFLNQSTMSESPSRAQRDLPYKAFDIESGVDQLQVMGVRYYMAQTDSAIAAATEHPDLTLITEAQPFVVFEVAGSELVEGLDSNPVVVAGPTEEQLAGQEAIPTRFDIGWESQAVKFYNEPESFLAFPAEDGPDSWDRFQVLEPTDGSAIAPATVSNITVGTNEISFDVDEVGAPVLVKVSYFPNWKVDGAEGPWRVGPNLMAVVPTSEKVSLSYGYTFPDIAGILLTLIGLAGLGYFATVSRRQNDYADEAVEGPTILPLADDEQPFKPSLIEPFTGDDGTSGLKPDEESELATLSGSGTSDDAAVSPSSDATSRRQRSAATTDAESVPQRTSASTATLDPLSEDLNGGSAKVDVDSATASADDNGIDSRLRSEDLPEAAEAPSENP